MAFFSVIIPLYNKENFIENTILSVLNQTFQDFEIIVVNDGSTDKSEEIVLSIITDKLKLIQHNKNEGLSSARNTGINNASSKYITFLDADDLWQKKFLEKILFLIQKYPSASLFATNYTEVHATQIKLNPKTNLKNFEDHGIVSDFFEASLYQPIYCCSSLCIEKSVFETIGYYNKKITYGEDIDFNIRANLLFKLAYFSKFYVDYIQNSENQITNKGITNKNIPNFGNYENLANNNLNLKKYLDFNRYVFAKMYKIENDLINYTKLKNEINPNNKISGLNYKQLLLLRSPIFILKCVKKIKNLFTRKGIKINTYN